MTILEEVLYFHDKMRGIEDKLKELTEITSTDYSNIGGKSSNKNSRVERLVVIKSELTEKYLDCSMRYYTVVKKLEEIISVLDPLERMLIRARYLDYLHWNEIADLIGFSLAHTHRLHRKILSKISIKDKTN